MKNPTVASCCGPQSIGSRIPYHGPRGPGWWGAPAPSQAVHTGASTLSPPSTGGPDPDPHVVHWGGDRAQRPSHTLLTTDPSVSPDPGSLIFFVNCFYFVCAWKQPSTTRKSKFPFNLHQSALLPRAAHCGQVFSRHTCSAQKCAISLYKAGSINRVILLFSNRLFVALTTPERSYVSKTESPHSFLRLRTVRNIDTP